MKILNLYSGIGGNRKLWGNEHDITAVEYNEKIADKYKSLFPNDTVIVADAHEYLLDHYKEYDFIWSSPPCQSHSTTNYFTQHIRIRPVYPLMSLYQEIIFLQNFYKGKFCVENVVSYYEPLIKPLKIGRHYLWSNFNITKIKQPKDDIGTMIKGHPNRANKKPLEERNAVNSELGLHILNQALGIIKENKVEQDKLF
jgi:DNA (cytosine-5)-methyltransferase 1|tara:strand:- start:121 stop:714 length:594 start_codon:yes stop_codon:yes gene_type:complete